MKQLLLAIVLGSVVTSRVNADEPEQQLSMSRPDLGSWVIVILRENGEVTASIPRGSHLRVKEIQENRLRVSSRAGRSWLDRSAVILLDEGIRYFSRAIRDSPDVDNGSKWKRP